MFDDFWGSCENHCFLVKLVRLSFGQLLEKLVLLSISTSGHTAWRSVFASAYMTINTRLSPSEMQSIQLAPDFFAQILIPLSQGNVVNLLFILSDLSEYNYCKIIIAFL